MSNLSKVQINALFKKHQYVCGYIKFEASRIWKLCIRISFKICGIRNDASH